MDLYNSPVREHYPHFIHDETEAQKAGVLVSQCSQPQAFSSSSWPELDSEITLKHEGPFPTIPLRELL